MVIVEDCFIGLSPIFQDITLFMTSVGDIFRCTFKPI
jgi:hypothetical protein